MHDLVVLKVEDGSKQTHYIMTWGRVFDHVNPEELETLVTRNAAAFGISEFRRAKVCETLLEAAGTKYFYESFFDFCQQKIPLGTTAHLRWRKLIRKEMKSGKHLAYCGVEPTKI